LQALRQLVGHHQCLPAVELEPTQELCPQPLAERQRQLAEELEPIQELCLQPLAEHQRQLAEELFDRLAGEQPVERRRQAEQRLVR
jgi:hypothetical protein